MKLDDRDPRRLRHAQSGFHENFLSLKPMYDHFKEKRLAVIYKSMMEVIKSKISTAVNDEQIRLMVEEHIKSYNPMTMAELKLLNNHQKYDYIQKIYVNDRKLLMETKDKVKKKYLEIQYGTDKVEDLMDQLIDLDKNIEKAAQRRLRALELDYVKKMQALTKVEAFKLSDQYKLGEKN